MLPYTPPVLVVQFEIGVDVKAFTFERMQHELQSKYKDNKRQQLTNANAPIFFTAGKLTVAKEKH